MDKITDHLFLFDGAGTITDFPGNYSDMREFRQQPETVQQPEVEKEEPSKKTISPRKGKLSYTQQREIKTLEKDINQLEKQKSELETRMMTPELPGEELDKASREFASVLSTLEAKTERWFELSSIEMED